MNGTVATVILGTIGSLIMTMAGVPVTGTTSRSGEIVTAYHRVLNNLLVDAVLNAQVQPGPGGGYDDVAKVKELLAKGANPNAQGVVPVLYHTISIDRPDLTKLLLEAGGDPNSQNDETKTTALHQAASFGHLEQMNLLLQWGAKVDSRDQWGDTPLHYAAMFGKTEGIKILLAAGADIQARSLYNFGETPLMTAAKDCDCPDALRTLIAAGGDPLWVDNGGNTPLDFAAANGHTGNVAVLIEAGADVNRQGAGRATPLISAAAFGHTETVRLLLAHGAKVTYRNAWGKSALDFAVERGYTEIAAALRAAGAN
jgi:ankyrin repeat protein